MWDFIKGLVLTRLCHKTMGGVQGTPNGYLEAESSAKNCLKGVRHIAQATATVQVMVGNGEQGPGGLLHLKRPAAVPSRKNPACAI